MDSRPNQQPDPVTQREQLTLLWMQAQPVIASYIRVGVRHQQHAEDLLQETALAAARSFGRFDAERPFLPWVMAIAKNKVIDYHKGKGKSHLSFSPELLSQLSADFEEDGGVVNDYIESLRHCMDRLAKTPQIAIELRYVRSLSYAQIGERIGRSVAGVANLLLRTRAALLACIEARLEAEEQR
ncbi:MAG: sigma-70 family RNA polymerase sigma factor [Phycisphaeraceae bacterium]